MKTKIGVPEHIGCLPLRRWLARAPSFEVHQAPAAELAVRLRRRELHAAYVSPLEYARESSEYRVLPGFALSSRSGISLYFREQLKGIGTMAANPAAASEIVLARIVLAEEFETAPPIVPVAGTHLSEMLGRAESALLTGDSQLLQDEDEHHSLDIAEAWSELVDLPYVHGILCAREDSVPFDAIVGLASHDWSRVSTRVLEEDLPGELRGRGVAGRASTCLRQYSFALTEEAQEGLLEFLRYSHYHGMIPDVPLFRLYPTGAGADDEN